MHITEVRESSTKTYSLTPVYCRTTNIHAHPDIEQLTPIGVEEEAQTLPRPFQGDGTDHEHQDE